MPVEMGLWRVDYKPVRLTPGGMPTEARLEELIEAEPTILGEPLLIIGRQVMTSFGKVIDLLAVDADGVLHVLELKKDKTPREVVAQVLDYGSWARSLAHKDVLKLFADCGKGGAFEAAFQQRFDAPPPEELNTGHRLTIIASAVDVATERIVEYLVNEYKVAVNVVFFRLNRGKPSARSTPRSHHSASNLGKDPRRANSSQPGRPYARRLPVSGVLRSDPHNGRTRPPHHPSGTPPACPGRYARPAGN
jgi:hypothetical protein